MTVHPIFAGVALALALLTLVLGFGRRPGPKSKVRKPHLKQDTEDGTTDNETPPDVGGKTKASRLRYLIYIAGLFIVGLTVRFLVRQTEWWFDFWSYVPVWNISFWDVAFFAMILVGVGVILYGGYKIWKEGGGSWAKRVTQGLIGLATAGTLIFGGMAILYGPEAASKRLGKGVVWLGKKLDNPFESDSVFAAKASSQTASCGLTHHKTLRNSEWVSFSYYPGCKSWNVERAKVPGILEVKVNDQNDSYAFDWKPEEHIKYPPAVEIATMHFRLKKGQKGPVGITIGWK